LELSQAVSRGARSAIRVDADAMRRVLREWHTDLVMLLRVIETEKPLYLPHSRSMGWYWPF
jgi:hypothetical protein